jgi:hypothetical protein
LALESATYINGLNVANPAASDVIAQADDHIRMLKAVLKNTFPNITGAVTQTQNMMNNAVVPIGGIIMWSGSAAAVPVGWKLCDGITYARSDGTGNITVPNLRNKFILGCGGSAADPTATPTIGEVGGLASVTPTITLTNEAVSLSVAQIPSHTHTATVTDPGHNHTITDPGHTHAGIGAITGISAYLASLNGRCVDFAGSTNSAATGITINNKVTGISVVNASQGSGSTHVHANTAVSSAVATIPPYYTLAFICKI